MMGVVRYRFPAASYFHALHAETGSKPDEQQLRSARIPAVGTALQDEEGNQQSPEERAVSRVLQVQTKAELVTQLEGLKAQLQEERQLLLNSLDAKAEALSALEQAVQKQAAQNEELRRVARELEIVAGTRSEVKALPEEL